MEQQVGKELTVTERSHPVRLVGAAAITTLALGTLHAEYIGLRDNPTAAIPAGACQSPRAVTETFPGLGNNSGFTNTRMQMGYSEGEVVGVIVPQDAQGVVAEFYNQPGDATNQELAQRTSGWNTSKMLPVMPSERLSEIMPLKFGRGAGQVAFGVKVISFNKADCLKAPLIFEEGLPASDFVNFPGRLPWPNFANVVTNGYPDGIPLPFFKSHLEFGM